MRTCRWNSKGYRLVSREPYERIVCHFVLRFVGFFERSFRTKLLGDKSTDGAGHGQRASRQSGND